MPDGTIKVGRLQRDLPAAALELKRDAPTGSAVLSFPASSELPVDRWFGTEVLSHKPGAIRMARVEAGAVPLLFNHDWSDPIGMVQSGSARDGRFYVDAATMFDTARAREVRTMIEGGLRNVSMGYQLHTVDEDVKRGIFTATDWEPLEVSIVTVPADPSVGIGRKDDDVHVVAVRTVADTQQEIQMSETQTPAAGQPTASPKPEPIDSKSAMQIEEARQEAVRNIAAMARIDERIWSRWIYDGTSPAEASKQAIDIQASRKPQESQAYLGMEPKEVRKFSIFRAVRALATGDWRDAQFEREASNEVAKKLGRDGKNGFLVPMDIQQRDLNATTTTAGKFLVATDNISFIEMLRNRLIVYQMGATRMAGLVGNVTIPKQTASATGYWLADETTAITESQQTFGQLALTPRTVGAFTQISRLLTLQSSPDAEALVMSDLAKVVATAVDLAALSGTGTEQPTGVTQTASIGTFTGTSLAAAGIIEAMTDVAGSNALEGSLGYVTTPAVAGLLMARPELPSTGTTRLWQGSLLDGTLFGLPARSSAQVATATMIFGAWQNLVVGEWGVLELAASENAISVDFQKGITSIRAFYTVDVGVRYAGAFSVATSIT